MDWQAALLARARADAGLTALIGARTYWEEAPQGAALPYLILNDITERRPQILNGWDLEAARVQLNAHALKYSEKQAVMEAAITALVPGITSNGHKFQRAMVEIGPRDAPAVTDGAVTVRTKQADLIIHHTPA